jgi:fatty acid desaturase
VAAESAPAIAGDLLTLSEIQDLRRVSGLRSAMLVLHAWATIAGAMLLYALWPSVFTLILAIALVGARQLGLAVLVHEGVHWRLFEHATVNNRTALWLCANPIWAELPAYRRRHHLHHRHTLEEDDPDLALSSPFPVPRAVLWRRVLGDLGGITACSRVLGWPVWREGFAAVWRRLRGPLAANAVLLGVLVVLGHWQLYLLLWVLPLATWYQLVSRVRDTAEHAMVSNAADPLRNTRTITAGLLERAFLAPYWVSYHLEHHLFVFMPCWRLREVHALLLAKGYGARMETASGYVEVLRRVSSTR